MMLEFELKVQEYVGFFVEAFLDSSFGRFPSRVTDKSVFDQEFPDLVDQCFGFADMSIEQLINTCFDQHIEGFFTSAA